MTPAVSKNTTAQKAINVLLLCKLDRPLEWMDKPDTSVKDDQIVSKCMTIPITSPFTQLNLKEFPKVWKEIPWKSQRISSIWVKLRISACLGAFLEIGQNIKRSPSKSDYKTSSHRCSNLLLVVGGVVWQRGQFWSFPSTFCCQLFWRLHCCSWGGNDFYSSDSAIFLRLNCLFLVSRFG